MTRFAPVLLVIAACSSDAVESDGLPGCQDCGPGAIKAGRFFETNYGPRPVDANRQGQVTVVLFDDLWWLDESFVPVASKNFGQSLISTAIADDGTTAVTVGHYFNEDFVDDHYRDAAVYSLAPDRSVRWSASLGTIGSAGVAASPDIVLVMTDAQQIGGVPIGDPSPYQHRFTMAALRASDGMLLWHKEDFGAVAFAGDGTLAMTGTFTGTLDLGGGIAPMATSDIDVFVAALDPLTGDARWAIQIDGGQSPKGGTIAASATGEIAMTWGLDSNIRADELDLIDAAGNVKWKRQLSPLGGLVTDGVHVIGGTYPQAFVQYSETGLDWKRTISSTGVNYTGSPLVLAGDRLVGSIYTDMLGGASMTTVGDVSYSGNGVAIVELAH